MQNLKFRIWAADSNRFYFLDSIFNTPDPCYTGEIQQFTGLIDSHGVEIWEGDIVHSGHNNTRSEIRFGLFNDPSDDGDDFGNGFYFFDRPGKLADYGCSLSLDIAGGTSQFEVIGNIYENAELLPPPAAQ